MRQRRIINRILIVWVIVLIGSWILLLCTPLPECGTDGAEPCEQPETTLSSSCPLNFAQDHVPGELIVRFVDDVPPPGWRSQLFESSSSGIRAPVTAFETGGYLVKVEGASDRELRRRAIALASEYPRQVAYIQENALLELNDAHCADWDPNESEVPNDPCRPNQTWLDDIGAPAAWNLSKGSHDVKVAVLDVGVDCGHEDLTTNCDLEDAKDFVDGDADPSPNPGREHGTAIAGIIGALTDNGTGVAGVNWHVSIVPLRVGESAAKTSLIELAVTHAMDVGARVLNMSFGSDSANCKLGDAIAYAEAADALVVAAAGDDGRSIDGIGNGHYPASGDAPNLVVVARARENWDSNPSNEGPCSVDIAAPGDMIMTTIEENKYGSRSGTSFATAVVSGAAALILSLHPDEAYAEVKDRLLATADRSTPMPVRSGGRLDLAAALQGPPPAFTDLVECQ